MVERLRVERRGVPDRHSIPDPGGGSSRGSRPDPATPSCDPVAALFLRDARPQPRAGTESPVSAAYPSPALDRARDSLSFTTKGRGSLDGCLPGPPRISLRRASESRLGVVAHRIGV